MLSNEQDVLRYLSMLLKQSRYWFWLSMCWNVGALLLIMPLFDLASVWSRLALLLNVLLVLGLGIVVVYYQIRIGFDRGIVQDVLQKSEQGSIDFTALDAALLDLKLISKIDPQRSFRDRVRGMKRLFTCQASVCLAQFVALVVGLLLGCIVL